MITFARRGRVRRRGADRRPRTRLGRPGRRAVRRLHRLRGALDPVVGAARLVVVRRQPAAVLPERRSRARSRWAPVPAPLARCWSAGWRRRCAALCGYSLLAKVFPSTLASANDVRPAAGAVRLLERDRRLRAALGLAPALWAATRRTRGTVLVRALTVPAMTLMISVIALSLSRSAVLVGVVGAAAWVVFVPRRLRSALMLGARRALWRSRSWSSPWTATTSPPTTSRFRAQDAAGHAFGPVLLGVLAVSTAGRLRGEPCDGPRHGAEPVRRRIGTVLLVRVALVPVAAWWRWPLSSRGLFGEISHAWRR